MENEMIIQSTEDGSRTIYIPLLDEHYHSTKGALAESLHVYINTCWRKAAELHPTVRVFEVGFGTGLNAALTAEAAMKLRIPTVYYSVELHPLDSALTDTLAYDTLTPYYSAVNKAEWGKPVEINPYFTLVKLVDNFLTMQFPEKINAIYYDAFAPEKQPEMWNEEVVKHLFDNMTPNGVLSTYCAKGVIRRMLQSVGFTVERLPGPPGGKREILRAVKNTL